MNYWTKTDKKHIGGTIEDWGVLSNGSIYGYIFKDSRGYLGDGKNFSDGQPVVTSTVIKIDYEAGTAETLNSVYTLGKKRQDE